jgi:gluconate kinase
MLFILFGLPGAGKTYAGKTLRDHYGYVFRDGDDDLTDELRQAVETSSPVDDGMRERFFSRLIEKVAELHYIHRNVVVAQTFIKERYRLALLKRIPDARFVLVQAPDSLRERRLSARREMPLAPAYVRSMVKVFEPPVVPHDTLLNTDEGQHSLLEQWERIISASESDRNRSSGR